MTGETNAYWIGKQRYIPDIAVVLHATRERLHADDINAAPYDYYPPDIAYDPYPPDLAIEVLSSDHDGERRQLDQKARLYVAAGSIALIVDRFQLHVAVYHLAGRINTLSIDDTLTLQSTLPGFELPLRTLFAYWL